MTCIPSVVPWYGFGHRCKGHCSEGSTRSCAVERRMGRSCRPMALECSGFRVLRRVRGSREWGGSMQDLSSSFFRCPDGPRLCRITERGKPTSPAVGGRRAGRCGLAPSMDVPAGSEELPASRGGSPGGGEEMVKWVGRREPPAGHPGRSIHPWVLISRQGHQKSSLRPRAIAPDRHGLIAEALRATSSLPWRSLLAGHAASVGDQGAARVIWILDGR